MTTNVPRRRRPRGLRDLRADDRNESHLVALGVSMVCFVRTTLTIITFLEAMTNAAFEKYVLLLPFS